MLFKRISRAQPEVVFLVAKNVSGSTITAGYSCVFDVGASVDGVRVTQASADDLSAYAGVADSDIANGDFGLLQVYGYRASVRIYTSAGDSVTGDLFGPTANQWGVLPGTTSGVGKSFGFVCEGITNSAGSSQFSTTAKAFIRAL